jgi:hypothetical protein
MLEMRSRRTIMGTALLSVVAGAIQSPAIATAQKRRVKQGELNGSIQSHALWLVDMSKGKRAVFNECDLSGLSFCSAGSQVDLTGADFTEGTSKGSLETKSYSSVSAFREPISDTLGSARLSLQTPTWQGPNAGTSAGGSRSRLSYLRSSRSIVSRHPL